MDYNIDISLVTRAIYPVMNINAWWYTEHIYLSVYTLAKKEKWHIFFIEDCNASIDSV